MKAEPKRKMKEPVIQAVRELMATLPVGSEVTYKTVSGIRTGGATLSSLARYGELEFKEIRRDPEGGKGYSVFITTGNKKKPSPRRTGGYGKHAQKKEPPFVLLCGRLITEIPPEAVKIHTMNG